MTEKKELLITFSGLGGAGAFIDRSLYNVTAVEINPTIAAVYKILFPNDTVYTCTGICSSTIPCTGDAKHFIEQNHQDFDIIIGSPPCQSFTNMRELYVDKGQNRPVIAEYTLLFGIIDFLTDYFRGIWYIENVASLRQRKYLTIYPPATVGKYFIWSNRPIPNRKITNSNVQATKIGEFIADLTSPRFPITKSLLSTIDIRKDTLLRNTMKPSTGLFIFDCLNHSMGY